MINLQSMVLLRRLLACCWLAFCLSVTGMAQAQQVGSRSVETTAVGANEMDAIQQALVSAINQANGTRVASVSVAAVRDSVRDNKVTSAAEMARLTATITQRAVKSYELLESAREPATPGQPVNPAQSWRVRIRAQIPTYNGGTQLKRLRLAVVPMQMPANLRSNGSAKKFATDFTEKLEILLTQSRRFAMLDRQFADVVDRELAQYKSDAFSAEETARIGKKAGTDYLVISSLARFEVIDQSVTMKMSGTTIPQKSAHAQVQVRLIDVATGQLKYARTFDSGDHVARGSGEATGMLGGVAEKAVSEIIAAIYPIAIVAADASSVTLGQGGDTIKHGQRFQVFSLGEAMKDPYTGESLGRREALLGLIEVTAVTDRVSTARIVDGAAAIAAKGGKDMIVRAAAGSSAAGPSGGAPAKASGGGQAAAKKPRPAGAAGKSDDGDW